MRAVIQHREHSGAKGEFQRSFCEQQLLTEEQTLRCTSDVGRRRRISITILNGQPVPQMAQ